MSNGSKLPLTDARAMTMKEVQIKIVTTAAMMPKVLDEKRGCLVRCCGELEASEDMRLLSRQSWYRPRIAELKLNLQALGANKA